MTRISTSSTSSVLSPYSISKKWIAVSIPGVLCPGGGLIVGLAAEALTYLLLLMVFNIFGNFEFLNTSKFSNGRVAVILLCCT